MIGTALPADVYVNLDAGHGIQQLANVSHVVANILTHTRRI